MKRIAVVAMQKEYAMYLRDNLARFLDKCADLRDYSMAETEELDFFEEEYVAVSAYTLFQNVKDKVGPASEMVILSLALTRENIRELAGLPKGTRALLVNIDYRTCMQVITNLYSVGFRDLELTPYFGAGDYDRSIRLAITTDEMQNVPKEMERVINIGQRSIDLNCIIDIADKLGVEGVLRSSEAFQLQKNFYFSNDSMEKILGENLSLAGRVNGLIKVMKQGILIADLMGSVLLCNEKAALLLKNRPEVLQGFNITDVLPGIDLTELQSNREQLIRTGGQTLVAVVTEVSMEQERSGVIVTVDNFEEMEEKQHGIRARLSQASHEARYHFDDIKGSSEALRETVSVAKRMAKSDSSVLITGESGTGKEVFAQSIHNESSRSSYNFVAVNCAAIPENLLESEMFGYEEGSFTGARKGGKTGYFEMAHRGTIFLDEIGEMPLMLQSKLLRVIEEKQIIRIGAQKVVDVDVRIIAATNKDLYALAEEGLFREDLYYRLGVLPIQIPPLRERKGDAEELLELFLSGMGRRLTFTPEARAVLREYPWRGNVRELRNAVEYMVSLEKEIIGGDELPVLMIRWMENGRMVSEDGRTVLENGRMVSENRGMAAEDEGAASENRGTTVSESGRAETPEGRRATALESGRAEAPEGRRATALEKGRAEAPEGRRATALDWTGAEENEFLLREGRRLPLYGFILSELERAFESRSRMGRASLQKTAEEQNLFYSEPEIRGALRRLDEWGYIQSARGRGGSKITSRGLVLNERIKGVFGQ